MGAKWQRIEIEIPEGYGPEAREAIAQEVIDVIVERTKSGKDKDGDEFRGYSESYEKSLDFKNAGKTPGQTPDFQQSGDTLASLGLLSHDDGLLVIGWERGSEANAIADGNIRGTYGSDTPNPKKARNILGVTKRELNGVLNQFPLENQDELDRQIAAYIYSKEAGEE